MNGVLIGVLGIIAWISSGAAIVLGALLYVRIQRHKALQRSYEQIKKEYDRLVRLNTSLSEEVREQDILLRGIENQKGGDE